MMSEESNPIKDTLFEYIEKSEIINKLIIEKKFDQIIEDIVKNCYDQVISMDEKDEAIGILAIGILHYLLTNSLVPSQRKLEYGGNQIDIVIPDIKTLEKDPKKALLICVPKSSDIVIVKKKISELEKNQSEKDNIWVVLSENMNIGKRSFVLSKENNTFSKIIFEIAKFTNVSGISKFKILRI